MVIDYTRPHWRRATATVRWTDYTNGSAVTGPTLDVLEATVTEEIAWCPTIEARLRVAFPATLNHRALGVFPLKFLDLALETGARGSTTPDAASSATWRLVISTVEVDHLAREISITAHSTDVMTLHRAYGESTFFGAGSSMNSIAYYMHRYLDPSGIYKVTVIGGTTAIQTPEVRWPATATGASILQDLCQQKKMVILALRNGNWQWRTVTEMETETAPYVIDKTNVLKLSEQFDVRNVTNAVHIKYSNASWAQRVDAGAYGSSSLGLRPTYIQRDQLGTGDTAPGVIITQSSRGSSRTQTTALAHYPLTAGNWVKYSGLRPSELSGAERIERIVHSTEGTMTIESIRM